MIQTDCGCPPREDYFVAQPPSHRPAPSSPRRKLVTHYPVGLGLVNWRGDPSLRSRSRLLSLASFAPCALCVRIVHRWSRPSRHRFVRLEHAMSEPLDRGKLLKLTSEIVAAYVSSNQIAPTELKVIIGLVAGSLAEVGDRPEPAPGRRAPAVPVRRSLGRDHLICLVCGKNQRTLKRHLAVRHQLIPDEYRERFGLRSEYPMVAPSYAALRSEMARRIGLGRKPAPAAPAAAPAQAAANQAGVTKTKS